MIAEEFTGALIFSRRRRPDPAAAAPSRGAMSGFGAIHRGSR